MWIVASFTLDGAPATGLSPTVVVRDVDTGSVVVNGVSMAETGDGFYSYDFSAYNPLNDYTVVCDSVTLSGTERYSYASTGEYNEVLDSIDSTMGAVDLRSLLLRKIQTNRLELSDGDSDNWVLYDDDGVTTLLTFDISDKDGNIIVQSPNAPSKRSTAVGTVSGSYTPDIYMRKSVYDPDDDGFVSNAENVSDGVYTSTASGVRYAVDNSHLPCILGTKCINESNIGDQFVVKYDTTTDRLVYGSGVITTHSGLQGLASDDHTQYILVDGTRSFTSTVGGITPAGDADLTTKSYVDTEITTATGSLTSDHGALTGLSDDDHTQYLVASGTRALTSTWNYGAQDISGSGNIFTTGNMGVGTVSTVARLEIEDGGTGHQILFKVTQDDQGTEGIVVSNDTYSTNDLLGINIRQRNSGESVIGNATNNTIVMDVSGGIHLSVGSQFVNEFSTDGTFAGNSDTAVPTEKAIKTYVNTVSGAIGGGGVSDHGALTGLSNDDHSGIYHSIADITTISGDLSSEIDSDITTHEAGSSHDGRYYTETEVDTWRNSTTQTEMGYVNGVSSDIQTQIDTKLSSAQFTVSSGDLQNNIDTNTTAIGLNTTHRGSDGSDHSIVGSNTTAIGLNTTHRSSDGSDHSIVGSNTSAITDNTTLITTVSGDLQTNIDALTHDGFADFVTNEHLDWTTDLSADNMHDNNIVASNVTQHEGSIDHGSISGLGDDDHPQYMLVASGISNIIEDTSPELGGDLVLGDYSTVLNTTPSGGVISGSVYGWSGEISTMTVDLNGNGIGTPLHMKTNGNWEQCTAASGTTTIPCTAIALEVGTGSKKILWRGIARKGTWSWAAGDIIYVSTVEGALTNTQPTSTGDIVQPLGVAIASDTVRFDLGLLWIEVE